VPTHSTRAFYAPVLSVPVVVGIGPCVPLLKVAESFRTASLVLDAARKLHACGTFGLEDLSWRLAALAQPDVGRFLAERYLMPLREEGDFGRLLEETMRAYLAQGQSIARAAGVLMVHVNTLRYRLRKFEDLTGTIARLDRRDRRAGVGTRDRGVRLRRGRDAAASASLTAARRSYAAIGLWKRTTSSAERWSSRRRQPVPARFIINLLVIAEKPDRCAYRSTFRQLATPAVWRFKNE